MIDRSPEHMDTILNYLRSGHLNISDRSVLPGMSQKLMRWTSGNQSLFQHYEPRRISTAL